jgi:putative acetyltransferase
MNIIIRPECPNDYPKIRQSNIEAFDTEAEANLVDMLRNSGIPLISLVAEINNEVVGHILFSPVTLENNNPDVSIAGLAPMAVLPEYQKKGIGAMLIKEGLEHCKKTGYVAVVVLGHPEYYPRFGFTPSMRYGIQSEYDVPDEVFMIKELNEGALDNRRGTIKYHELFKQP